MFSSITIPFGAKMLFNLLMLKPGVEFEDIELAVGELCDAVKNTYGGGEGGFIAGQVFRLSGSIREEGSLSPSSAADRVAIITYWRSFEDHERSHGDRMFQEKFSALGKLCTEIKEQGYDMLWQGAPE